LIGDPNLAFPPIAFRSSKGKRMVAEIDNRAGSETTFESSNCMFFEFILVALPVLTSD